MSGHVEWGSFIVPGLAPRLRPGQVGLRECCGPGGRCDARDGIRRSGHVQGALPRQVPARGRRVRPHPAGRPHLPRHRLWRAAAPGAGAHRLREGAPESVLRRRDHPGLDAGRRALHRRTAQVELPTERVLHRQQHANGDQHGAGRLHADLPVRGPRAVPPADHLDRHRPHPDVAARSPRLSQPRRVGGHREGCGWKRPADHRAGEPADAARAGRRLPAHQRGGLRPPVRRAAARIPPERPRRHRHPHRPLRRPHRRGRRHDPGGLRQRAERHHVGARAQEAPGRAHRAADRRPGGSGPVGRDRQLPQDDRPRQDGHLVLHGQPGDLRLHRRQPDHRVQDDRLHQ